MSQIAMQTYLSTSGADKVGFTSENGKLVGGTRGVMERNTMRYFLAIDAYLDIARPAAGQAQARAPGEVVRRDRALREAAEGDEPRGIPRPQGGQGRGEGEDGG
jgi:hypothetical protein